MQCQRGNGTLLFLALALLRREGFTRAVRCGKPCERLGCPRAKGVVPLHLTLEAELARQTGKSVNNSGVLSDLLTNEG